MRARVSGPAQARAGAGTPARIRAIIRSSCGCGRASCSATHHPHATRAAAHACHPHSGRVGDAASSADQRGRPLTSGASGVERRSERLTSSTSADSPSRSARPERSTGSTSRSNAARCTVSSGLTAPARRRHSASCSGCCARTPASATCSASTRGATPWRCTRRLAYVPGDVALWPSLTGGETIDVLGRLRGGHDPARRASCSRRSSSTRRRRSRRTRRATGRRSRWSRRSHRASSSTCFDEPTTVSTRSMSEVFRDVRAALHADGRTVLLSSHVLARPTPSATAFASSAPERTVEIRARCGHAAPAAAHDRRRDRARAARDQRRARPARHRATTPTCSAARSTRATSTSCSRTCRPPASCPSRATRRRSRSCSCALRRGRLMSAAADASSRASVLARPAPASAFAGTGALLRLALRRDRVRIPAWVVFAAYLTMAVAQSWDRLYPTTGSRRELAASLAVDPTLSAILGPLFDPLGTGGLTAWRIGSGALLAMGLVASFLVVRHSRATRSRAAPSWSSAGPSAAPHPWRRRCSPRPSCLLSWGAALRRAAQRAGPRRRRAPSPSGSPRRAPAWSSPRSPASRRR